MHITNLVIILFFCLSFFLLGVIYVMPASQQRQKEKSNNDIKLLSKNRLVFNKNTGFYEKVFDLDDDDIEVLN